MTNIYPSKLAIKRVKDKLIDSGASVIASSYRKLRKIKSDSIENIVINQIDKEDGTFIMRVLSYYLKNTSSHIRAMYRGSNCSVCLFIDSDVLDKNVLDKNGFIIDRIDLIGENINIFYSIDIRGINTDILTDHVFVIINKFNEFFIN